MANINFPDIMFHRKHIILGDLHCHQNINCVMYAHMVMQYFAFISECCYLMHDKQLLFKVKWMIRCLCLLCAIIRTPTWQNSFNNDMYIILTINPSSWFNVRVLTLLDWVTDVNFHSYTSVHNEFATRGTSSIDGCNDHKGGSSGVGE